MISLLEDIENNVVEYETRLTDGLPQCNMPAVCYDLTRLSASLVMEALTAYSQIIVRDDFIGNPFYGTPADFLNSFAFRC